MNRIIAKILSVILFPITYFFPRDSNLWIFGAGEGTRFTGNSKYLFLYVDSQTQVRSVWLSENQNIVEELKNSGYEAYHRNSLKGIYFSLRARASIVTHDNRDLNPWLITGSTVVCLWHGFPLKHISWDSRLADAKSYVKLFYSLNTDWDLFCVPSEISMGPFESGLRHPLEDMRITGYPRNDELVGAEFLQGTPHQRATLGDEDTNRFTFIYLPTYRREGENPLNTLNWTRVNGTLDSINAKMFVKPHPRQSADIPSGVDQISVLDGDIDVYPLLGDSDALITDYSSVYFDYLLLDKPILYYSFDRDEYQDSRGLYFEYSEVTPGPVAKCDKEFNKSLEGIVESDEYGTEREDIQKKFMPTFDQSYSERTFQMIMTELKNS
jgi:CDP-glycerol glycerophosphotransferase (TagB/SpsB family)